MDSVAVLSFFSNTPVKAAVASQLSADAAAAAHRSSAKVAEQTKGGLLRDRTPVEEPLVSACDDETVEALIERLVVKRVSSVPVFSSTEEGKLIGVLDFSSLAAFVVAAADRLSPSLVDGPEFWSKQISSCTVADVLKEQTRNPVTPTVSVDAPLMDAVKAFADGASKPRRLLVVDPEADGRIVAVLAACRPFQYLSEIHPEILTTRTFSKAPDGGSGSSAESKRSPKSGDVLDKSVGELGVGVSPVLSVPRNAPMMHALRLMHEQHRSIVAIVNEGSGALMSSISCSDIKAVFQAHKFSVLRNACWDFVVKKRNSDLDEDYVFFGVKDDCSLHTAVLKLLATNVHHLYVVDSHTRPACVVSFQDVYAALVV